MDIERRDIVNKNFYVTTPIYYVNGDPHVGSAYTTIAADVMARYKRTMGYDAYFLTGTDEHGQKVEETAKQKGYTPQQWTDIMAPRFKEMWAKLGIEYSDFIRFSHILKLFHNIAKIMDKCNKHIAWDCLQENPYNTIVGQICLPNSRIRPMSLKSGNYLQLRSTFRFVQVTLQFQEFLLDWHLLPPFGCL